MRIFSAHRRSTPLLLVALAATVGGLMAAVFAGAFFSQPAPAPPNTITATSLPKPTGMSWRQRTARA